MLKVILQASRHIAPFNESARDLRVQNLPLWLLQRDLLAPYVTRELELPTGAPLPVTDETCLVYRDNLFFDEFYLKAFLNEARKRDHPSRAAFSSKDLAFREHALPLSTSYTQARDLYLADLWYFPRGPQQEAEPLVIDLLATEVGYYHVPTYMAADQGDLTFQVPLRSLIAIDCWVHIFIADIVFGLFAHGARFEDRMNRELAFKLSLIASALYEGKQLLETSKLVSIGENCVIDPSVTIHGPTVIGNNVTVGAGAVIENCIIGDNVNISQGCQLMLSVVGDGTFLPFRSSLFMTTLMDNSMVAQNTCLQMCVVGRNTFIGSGSTFTDYNLIPIPIRALDGEGLLQKSNRPVIGGCVGHNCRLGAGIIVSPARIIESDVVLIASETRRVITHNVSYEESDHHTLKSAHFHQRLYPRLGEAESESW
jgi:carbonic anhydrase/acetyltransferase-like protein (isoleucine patch superfamily)